MPKTSDARHTLGAAVMPEDSMNDDPCCVLCSHPLGICRTRHTCDHHKDAQKQDEANHRARRTVRDPTGDRAAARADRQKRRQERN